jgi:hypothetical protein
MIDDPLSDAWAMFQALDGPGRPYTTTREAEERFHLHARRMRHNTSGTAGDRNLWSLQPTVHWWGAECYNQGNADGSCGAGQNKGPSISRS